MAVLLNCSLQVVSVSVRSLHNFFSPILILSIVQSKKKILHDPGDYHVTDVTLFHTLHLHLHKQSHECHMGAPSHHGELSEQTGKVLREWCHRQAHGDLRIRKRVLQNSMT